MVTPRIISSKVKTQEELIEEKGFDWLINQKLIIDVQALVHYNWFWKIGIFKSNLLTKIMGQKKNLCYASTFYVSFSLYKMEGKKFLYHPCGIKLHVNFSLVNRLFLSPARNLKIDSQIT
jgi:hypothetical protein